MSSLVSICSVSRFLYIYSIYTFRSRDMEQHLASLNAKQRQAVTAPHARVLQIVAGPGTGKTKVLVSRVAHLLSEGIPPHAIIVTTFTKKAATEMTERLRAMFAGTDVAVGRLLIGTFHSICYRIIQRYGLLIGCEGYTIADEKDAQQTLKEVLGKRITPAEWAAVEALPEEDVAPFKTKDGYNAKVLRKRISSLKAAGTGASEYARAPKHNALLALVYLRYDELLSRNRLLDFDDCLLYCHRIVSRHRVLGYVQHTLVDEFQDTNEIQLQLMYHFARGHPSDDEWQHNLTIVGDPDQSIYAFRDAQLANFDKMKRHYLAQGIVCDVITLDENYRSTSGILALSESVMRQQQGRMAKNLRSQFPDTFLPHHSVLLSAEEEARWIAHHIEYLHKLPALFLHSDMAVLVRSAYQTRAIEAELAKKRIPYLMVRGRAFWQRKEVLAMLDYLRCVANDNDRLAFLRSVNFPKRGLGPKAIAELETKIEQQQLMAHGYLVFETLHKVATSEIASAFGPKMKESLKSFVDIIARARTLAGFDLEQSSPGDISSVMDQIFTLLYSESGLRKEFEEDENCDLNVMEVKDQLLTYQIPEEEDLLDYNDPAEEVTPALQGTDFLQKFLSLISLYNADPGSQDESLPKVSISTIHGAKGLEWPVVFVPGLGQGILPSMNALQDPLLEALNEERRCFYVATSRAKVLLHISAYTETSSGDWGRSWGKPSPQAVSVFIEKLGNKLTTKQQLNDTASLQKLASMLNKEVPESFDIDKHFEKYKQDLLKYVLEETEPQLDLGFVSAAKVTFGQKRMARIQSVAAKSKQLRAPQSDTFQRVSSKAPSAPTKAPPYVPSRSFKPHRPLHNINANSVKVASAQSTTTNKAPVYVVERSANMKRLGTKK